MVVLRSLHGLYYQLFFNLIEVLISDYSGSDSILGSEFSLASALLSVPPAAPRFVRLRNAQG